MRVCRDLDNLPEFKNAVITIGTYDGVHSGHQKIIERLNQIAQKIHGETVILTFHPHPRLVIQPDNKELKLLNTLDEKIELLGHYGIDNLIVAPFSLKFSQIPAESYVKDFLWGKIKPKVVVIGFNHKFGNNREGDIHLIREIGKDLDFEVEEISQQTVDHISVSSTKIRRALQSGDVALAHSLLGHHYSIQGKVVEGEHVGTKIGFPTANILIKNQNKLIPANGVYAVLVNVNGAQYFGMLNIGLRPTFNGTHTTIEVHIFDFEENIYGVEIQVEFIDAIRQEMKFESPEALAEQLSKDMLISKELLGKTKKP